MSDSEIIRLTKLIFKYENNNRTIWINEQF